LTNVDVEKSGSAMLAFLLKESLIFSQYDRVVQEQERAVQSRIQSIEEKVQRQREAENEKEK